MGETAMDTKLERQEIVIEGQRIGYSLYSIDGRTESQRVENARRGGLDGNPVIFLPGHGQRATAAKNLHSALLESSRSKLLVSIDVDPPPGGDPMKAVALIAIIRQWLNPWKVAERGKESSPPLSLKVTLVGWSHGGADALRVAEKAPDLIEQVAIICPAGLEERPIPGLLLSFTGEVLRIALDCTRRGRFAIIAGYRIGTDFVMGLLSDLIHTRSPARLIHDLRWGAQKVVGPHYAYDGDVLVLFGMQDSVIRWRGALQGCQAIEEIPGYVDSYKSESFPMARSLQIQVLEGNHLAPEVLAPRYAQAVFDTLGFDS